MTCKDCILYERCNIVYKALGLPTTDQVQGMFEQCPSFKDKSRYIELPCKVGDKLYYIPFGKTIEECNVNAVEYTEKAIVIKCHLYRKECEALLHKHLIYFDNDDFGETVFLSREEAKKALAERSNNENN